ncbi:RsmB/NOP family class I SAM-dependent RNA methyltransferase [Candidatus Liberibacter solanacearum]|uniref:MFS transporter n=1 Tax=Candidatus Liberibacter solanacearum TaxID=556287 RepID=A0A1V2N8U3_9HYPH|nr:RsmB/NOP family class I SAM-dependent RNA methyltransferase [Candidatus Liberibacter solanacearum]ONI59781.1 MFS transporter [Candidatus Liberibacter solanacearum]ONI60010.1 MFS transporter [Candidatus Liberibacter solanacearum]
MRLGGQMAAAIEILKDIIFYKKPATNALKDWSASHRFAGSSDRVSISNIVYDVLRKYLSNAYIMDDDNPDYLVYAVIIKEWNISLENISTILKEDRFGPLFPKESIIKSLHSRQLENAPLHIQGNIPQWLQSSIQSYFKDNWLEETKWLSTRPPLDLRTNTLKVTRQKLFKNLHHHGVRYSSISRFGLRIAATKAQSRLPNITNEISFQRGWFEVQDEGSQIVSDLTATKQSSQILDFCAGGGGKTLALSMLLNNKGQIHAWDKNKSRIAPIVARIKRAGIHNVQLHSNLESLRNLQEHFTTVLVDAPCSGTGTWRRRPDIKWRLSPKNLMERIEEQKKIMQEAAKFVRLGGYLVYITCSILPEENIQQINNFLDNHPRFRIDSIVDNWNELYDLKNPRSLFIENGCCILTPFLTNTDGFFFCRLKRHI